MTHFQWFKGLIFIALACLFTTQGSSVVFGNSQDKPSTAYQVAVSSGQSQQGQASANISISGENSKVSVSKEGAVSIVAGKSIILRPGTKVSSGGFLYATIGPMVKTGKHQKKEVRIVTVEEKNKIEEQASLSIAFDLFRPYPTRSKGYLHAGDAEQGSYYTSYNTLSGVSPEQQRKVAVDSRLLPEVARKQILIAYHHTPAACLYRPQTMMVLRL